MLHEGDVDDVAASLVIEGANIPATEEAERRLHDRGVLNVPDFIANAGGVICAAVEFRGGTELDALAEVEEKIRRNVTEVLTRARDGNVPARDVAVAMAEERVRTAMSFRRFV